MPLMFVRLFTADGADRQAAKHTLDLFVEHREEASVASLLSYSKYMVLSNHHFLTVCHGRFKRAVVLGIFVNDR